MSRGAVHHSIEPLGGTRWHVTACGARVGTIWTDTWPPKHVQAVNCKCLRTKAFKSRKSQEARLTRTKILKLLDGAVKGATELDKQLRRIFSR